MELEKRLGGSVRIVEPDTPLDPDAVTGTEEVPLAYILLAALGLIVAFERGLTRKG